VTADDLRAHCLAQPEAVEEFPFTPEHSVFKVEGKMFALSALGRTPLEINLKCEPDLASQFRDTYESVRPGYHMNKRHWNTITIGGDVPDRLLRDMIEDSYDLVVDALPKRTRERLRALR
jgi:predicted DNA-binding protein (MmcQ/YjbR family)